MLLPAICWLLLYALTSTIDALSVATEHPSLVVGTSGPLHIASGFPVLNSPGTRPGTVVSGQRVCVHGLPRTKNLHKFSNSVKVNVTLVNSTLVGPKVEICFHRNMSLGIAMCPQGQWEKLSKGSWVRTMSPFDHKVLDIRMTGASQSLQVSIEEVSYTHRILFLIMGILLMVLATSMSKSVVFYYNSAMAVGIILVVLMVLFQGMKLLPTGRKRSLAIFLYSSFIGVGSFLLSYLPRFLQTVLAEFGIDEDVYNLLKILLLLCAALAGAWLGFWMVRKLILDEDGSINSAVSVFVACSIRVVAAVLILLSSLDPLLAMEALVCSILVTSTLRKAPRMKLSYGFYEKLSRPSDGHSLKAKNDNVLPSAAVHPEAADANGLTRILPHDEVSSFRDTFYSTFHNVKERRKFSKEEWDSFTKESTKSALEDLVSSPDFSKWAVANAERITLNPRSKNRAREISGWRRWFFSN